MSDLKHREEMELRFRKEVEEAEREWREATPQEKPEARRRFREALLAFTTLVLYEAPPKESGCD